MYRPPRTAIIGAGISGLTTAKNLGDAGVEYVCFESSDRVGGNWAFRNPNGHSSAYRSLHIDTSRDLLSFKDFPMDRNLPDYPHHSEIKEYLDDYTDAFGLREHIEFETAVEHAHRLDGGGWELQISDGSRRRFDALVVANGHHWDPRLPNFPGHFTGETIHSHSYIDPTEPLDLRGKRIVVVGIGNSAADLVSELSQKAWQNNVYLSTRSGAWVVPKYILGLTADKLAYTLPVIPLSWQRRAKQILPRLLFGNPEHYGLPTPDHKFLEAHPTQSAELLMRLGSGDAIAKPDIERLDGDHVVFTDGSRVAADVIIYATGYNITFPFFDPEFLCAPDNRLPLYKRMFKPGIDDLVFVGFAQALPTLFPFVECQARLAAAYLGGSYRLPTEAEMHRVIAADERKYIGHFKNRPRHTQQVDYFDYERDIRKRELPAGRCRVARYGPVRLAGRAEAAAADAV
ncbi:flavin-containing monooxygenase [Mycolicibacterium thermoresistibile]|uniref:Flavin-binding monooxygenase n=2 Tax=Mycolicibacterium thermoresistibile TaxID=1797 RepID=G7CBY4_MYCT3|nr:NAD(P)-binding domain-containing protein [Mycolicibacterium thermoresistibile]EHI14481.1 flavin-binding monooxygenase [Mycolicibacterium thermoresistibile ATCC 19527]MCV7187388.1 NAD(P)-binding domain-containing protein [Mycolicibacterium thermoresistibile]GAT16997.1 flavin-binding monooxygenase [Mycolicibacterium thermoresistibile]SNW16622.1 monooxygenase ETHA [Mycolicibacterium thermoresistibile]